MARLLWPLSSRQLILVLSSVLLLVTIVGLTFMNRRLPLPDTEEPKTFKLLASKTEILSEVGPESVDQTIEGLPSFLDQNLAAAASGGDFCPEAYATVRRFVPRLTRVRKLLGQIDERQRPHYTAVFLKKLEGCMQGFAKSWKEELAAMHNAKGPLLLAAPTNYGKKQATATALVYILTEWDRQEAVPTFAWLLEQLDPLPVNRLFLLYSTHVLIGSMPTAGFSQDKLDKLAAYKRLSRKHFPEVERTTVTAWNAKYDETDFRVVILGEPVPVASQPTIQLRFYPDIDDYEHPNTMKLGMEADALQRTMLSCLRAK